MEKVDLGAFLDFGPSSLPLDLQSDGYCFNLCLWVSSSLDILHEAHLSWTSGYYLVKLVRYQGYETWVAEGRKSRSESLLSFQFAFVTVCLMILSPGGSRSVVTWQERV